MTNFPFFAIVGVAVASSFLSMIAILLVQKLLYIPQNIVFFNTAVHLAAIAKSID